MRARACEHRACEYVCKSRIKHVQGYNFGNAADLEMKCLKQCSISPQFGAKSFDVLRVYVDLWRVIWLSRISINGGNWVSIWMRIFNFAKENYWWEINQLKYELNVLKFLHFFMCRNYLNSRNFGEVTAYNGLYFVFYFIFHFITEILVWLIYKWY